MTLHVMALLLIVCRPLTIPSALCESGDERANKNTIVKRDLRRAKRLRFMPTSFA